MKKFQSVAEVVAEFATACRAAGLARNTIRGYTATVEDFATLLKTREIDGPQAYFDHLATVRRLSAQSVCHALNPLKFLYERVLEGEFGTMGAKGVDSPLDAGSAGPLPTSETIIPFPVRRSA